MNGFANIITATISRVNEVGKECIVQLNYCFYLLFLRTVTVTNCPSNDICRVARFIHGIFLLQ